MVTGVVGKVPSSALIAGKDSSSQCRSAALGDGADGAALMGGKVRVVFEELREEHSQRLDDRGGMGHKLARQTSVKILHQPQRLTSGLMREVQIDHRRFDLFVTHELLDGVEMSTRFQEMRCKAVTQGMD